MRFDTAKYPLDSAAVDIGVFRQNLAAEDYLGRYSKARKHRAFAQSRSGAFGWSAGSLSVDHAMQAALDDCRGYNNEQEATEPCRIVNVNGRWGAELRPSAEQNPRHRLAAAELIGTDPDLRNPVHYDYFMPMGQLNDRLHRLEGRLAVPDFKLRARRLQAKKDAHDNAPFPGFEIDLVTAGDVLLPLQRDRMLLSADRTWYYIVSTGKLWRESADGDWSRGSFPLTLVHAAGSVPLYGVVTFLFNDRSMSQLRIQFSQETANWAQFDLWGQIDSYFTPGPVEGAAQVRADHAKKAALALDVRPWHELETRYALGLEAFDGEGNRENISVSGLLLDDRFYLRSCRTRAGPHPYCRQMRHGVFSITKSLAGTVSMLWLAEKYGAGVFDEKITDHVDIRARHDGWKDVTFGNALDMATGIGDRIPERVDYYVELDDTPIANQFWQSKSLAEKIEAIARYDNYPWGPGEVFRYRSADTFVLGAAMQAFIRKKQGPKADLWEALTQEVFQPLGIDRLPIQRTIETDGSRGTPMMSSGLYPTFEEVIKIARLLQNHGEFEGRQLLHRQLTARTVSADMNRGLPNGWVNRQGGRGHYDKGFWLSPQNWADCELRTTGMAGFGGNYVIIMPNDTIGLRFADGHDDDPATWDSFGIRSVAHELKPFC